jgi:uncharacterized protein (TIGR02246 family)
VDAETAIRGLTQDFCMAFNTGNYDQAVALFSPDGLFMLPNQEPAHGAKAIERTLQECADAGYQDLRLETTRVEQAGDMAVEVGRYTLSIHRPNGTTVMDRGKYMTGWRRLGAWRVFANCWSSNLPAMGE